MGLKYFLHEASLPGRFRGQLQCCPLFLPEPEESSQVVLVLAFGGSLEILFLVFSKLLELPSCWKEKDL